MKRLKKLLKITTHRYKVFTLAHECRRIRNLFEYFRVEMHKKGTILVISISKINPQKKVLNLETSNENQYYALVYRTSREVVRE